MLYQMIGSDPNGFISEKARNVRILNVFKYDPFCTQLLSLFMRARGLVQYRKFFVH